jgi:hypothetical protein
LLAVGVVAVAPAPSNAAGTPAPPGLKVCHAVRTCPSSTHAYAWRGLICADRAHRTSTDTIPAFWRGREWWCRAKPAPPPPPTPPTPQPEDPLARFKAAVATFVQQYLDAELTQVRTDAGGGYAALANGPGLAALLTCASTLGSGVGAAPPDPVAVAALAQLQTMCTDFQTAATEIRDGFAAQDSDKVDAGLDQFKAGRDLRNAIVSSLGLGL